MPAASPIIEKVSQRTPQASHDLTDRARDRDVSAMTSVFEIDDLATLAESQPIWRHLLDQTPGAAFCQTFEWLQLYMRHFGDEQRLRAFFCTEADDVVGLAVLMEVTQCESIRLMLPHIGRETMWPLGSDSHRTWRTVAQQLREEFTRKHVLDLVGLSHRDRTIAETFRATGLKVDVEAWPGATRLRLDGGYSTHWSKLPPSLKTKIQSAEQQLATIGSTKFVRLRPKSSERIDARFPAELYDDCLQVALNDEEQLQRPGSVLNDPARHAFLRDLFPWSWRCAAADLCLVMVGSRPVAFRFHTFLEGRVRTVWTGVDAEFRGVPLATVLLHRTLRDSLERGDVELDLGTTPPEVARNWNAEFNARCRIVVGSSSPAPFNPQEMLQYAD